MTALVIGIGNAWRGDDAAGFEVTRRLRDAGLHARDADPSGLPEAWEGERDVVLVDAVRSGAPPGAIHRLDARSQPLPAWLASASTHHLGLGEVVELGRALGRLPERLEVYGIEGCRFDPGSGLSLEVAGAVDQLAAELASMLRGPLARTP